MVTVEMIGEGILDSATGRGGPRRRVMATGLVAAMVFLAPRPVAAHLGSTKYLDIDVGIETVRVGVQVEAIDAAAALDLMARDASRLDPTERVALDARLAEVGAWLEQAIIIRPGDPGRGEGDPDAAAVCHGRAGEPQHRRRDGRDFIHLELLFSCAQQGDAFTGRTFLEDGAVFDRDGQHEAIVRIRTRAGTDARVLRRGHRWVALGGQPSNGDLFIGFVGQGAVHLVTGYDHLLFLLSLLLGAGMTASRQGFRAATSSIAVIVTAFTLGHSITLATAALDLIRLPSRWVETIIALSIVLVALYNLFGDDVHGRSQRRLHFLAFFFGLIHGFGFASVLAEVGLPAAQQVLALFAFNIGIEAAQLGCVLVVIVPLAIAAARPWYRRWVMQGGSILIAAIAALWFAERAFELTIMPF